jgi:uncharacterized protein (TIGR03118 family)
VSLRIIRWLRQNAARHEVGTRRAYRPALEALEDRCLLSGGFVLTRLTSDIPGFARFTDPNLINPWGISLNSTDPFWIADNRSGVSTLVDGQGRIPPLVVQTPGVDAPVGTATGTVFNGGPGFVISENGRAGPSQFLFATEDGLILGWSAGVDVTHALVAVNNYDAAVYKGLALATNSQGTFLYAANFFAGTIDVFDQGFHAAQLSGSFSDPAIPAGFAPFNIQSLGGRLYVTYAKQNAVWHDDVPGPGNGYVDVFDTNGNLLSRLVSGGALNSPWGLALAPANFGEFSNDLLVGNSGDGRINAYNPQTGAFVGQLKDAAGIPIQLEHLWGLAFGNGGGAGGQNTLYFTAGIGHEQHGLFGKLVAQQGIPSGTSDPGNQDTSTEFADKGFSNYLRAVLGKTDAYPLLPSSGPALQTDVVAQPPASAVLLPVSESSFVMAPALLTVSPRDAGRGFIDPASPAASASLGGSIYTIVRGAPGPTVDPFAASKSEAPVAEEAERRLGSVFVSTPRGMSRYAVGADGNTYLTRYASTDEDGADQAGSFFVSMSGRDTIEAPVLLGERARVSEESDEGAAEPGAAMAALTLTTPEEWGYAAGSPDWIVGFTTLVAVCCSQLAWSPRRGSPPEGEKERISLRSIGS